MIWISDFFASCLWVDIISSVCRDPFGNFEARLAFEAGIHGSVERKGSLGVSQHLEQHTDPTLYCNQDKWDELDDECKPIYPIVINIWMNLIVIKINSSNSHTVIDFFMIPMDNFLVWVEW